MNEAELRVEVLRLAIRNQAYIATFRHMGFDVFHDLDHDPFTQALALVLFENGNVHHLKDASAVPDDPPHPHDGRPMKDLNGEERIGQTLYRCFIRLCAEAGANTQSLVSLNGGRFQKA